MFLIFLIISLVLSVSIFFVKNSLFTTIMVVIYSFLLIGVSAFSYLHIDEINIIYYKFDALGVLLTFILSLLSIVTFYYSYFYFKRKEATKKQKALYYSSLIMFITAMISAYFAENLALLWVSIEATSIFVSVLIFHLRTKDAIEATWKYLFISSVGLAIMFIGILFLSIVASDNGINSLSFTNLMFIAQDIDTNWIKIAFILIVTGLSVKINVFPLYSAAIDAKTITASPVNALMSTALVNVGFVGIYRIYVIIAQTLVLDWAQNVLMIVGVISILITAIQLTRVKRLKRMLAFSSMEHVGIVLIGLSVGGVGYYAAILHIVFHSFVKASLFYQIGSIHQFFRTIWIKKMGNYFKLNPIGGLTLIFGVISILAIPPSGLFVSELMIFKALFANYNVNITILYVAIFVLILLTIIIYTISKASFHLLYNEISADNLNKNAKVYSYESIPSLVLLALVVYLGINPPLFFIDLINSAIAVLN